MSDTERAATQAEAILSNPTWQRAWNRLDTELWEAFQDMPPEHAEGLRTVALRRWALVTIRAELERIMAQPLLDKLNAE